MSSIVGESEIEFPLADKLPNTVRNGTRQTNKSGKSRPVCEWDRSMSSDRSAWWRSTIRDGPDLGIYTHRTFLEEMDRNPVRRTYQFKNDGRKKDIWKFGRGDLLLPGVYSHEDINDWLKRHRQTYGFKAKGRSEDCLTEGLIDKQLIKLSPNSYNLMNHHGIDAQRQGSFHGNFRSKTKRLPSMEFQGKGGPDPGHYDSRIERAKPLVSMFQSGAPRFRSSVSKVPGPGSYDRTVQAPMPTSIASMGRQHGLFFASSFQ